MKRCLIGLCIAVLVLTGCGKKEQRKQVKVDGSSTVAPITTVAKEMFNEKHPDVRVTVRISGTGGGFKNFHDQDAGLRTDINDASRPIKPSEIEKTREVNVEFVEIPIALDGIAVIVHPENEFCEYLTVDELKKIWEPGSTVNNWNQVRDGFPDLRIELFGPGKDSGTFDYFTEAINGKEGFAREEFTASEDDNVLVQGVSGTRGSLGYFGFAYYDANKDKLKLLAIDNGNGKPIKPDVEAIRSNRYKPLSRPLFLYINKTSLQRDEVRSFLDFYLDNAVTIVAHPNVNYVPLPNEVYEIAKRRIEKGVTGSPMNQVPEDVEELDLAEVFAVSE